MTGSALDHLYQRVGRLVGPMGAQATRPENLYRIHHLGWSEPEVDRQAALRMSAGAANDLTHQRLPSTSTRTTAPIAAALLALPTRRTLPKRFAKYGLTVHEEKTRLLRFRPPGRTGPGASFRFLGFTHYWGRSRRGGWMVKRKTASDRLNRALRAVSVWCRRQRHTPLREQHAGLRSKLLGHYGYYGITGNGRSLGYFHQAVKRLWLKWLNRRGGRRLNWACFARLLRRYPLPLARIVHSIYAARPAT